VDWLGLVEELCERVLAAEKAGLPAIHLRELSRPDPGDVLEVDGIPLLARHPVIMFGDGGDAKSLTALYLAGRLAERGNRVLYADWEFAGVHQDEWLALLHECPGVRRTCGARSTSTRLWRS
jgi:Mrp family chromosome partitioning ATPase